jgi:hypothetical protein
MNRSDLPNGVLSKLFDLDEHVEHLTRRLANTEQGIADARRRLSGGFRQQAEYDDLSASLKQLLADKPTLEKKLHSAQSVLSNCKVWLDRLPEGTTLEPVGVKTDGHALAQVRAHLEAAQAELAGLQAVPTPGSDIEARIRAYVGAMARARPTITGIDEGEKFKVIWPGAGFDSRGPREDRADVLPLMALLCPDAMTAALMREVERMTNDPVPQAERRKRIAALEHEIEQLAYIEEPLVADAIARGEDVQRSPSALPQAVLQVRIAEAKRSRAA